MQCKYFCWPTSLWCLCCSCCGFYQMAACATRIGSRPKHARQILPTCCRHCLVWARQTQASSLPCSTGLCSPLRGARRRHRRRLKRRHPLIISVPPDCLVFTKERGLAELSSPSRAKTAACASTRRSKAGRSRLLPGAMLPLLEAVSAACLHCRVPLSPLKPARPPRPWVLQSRYQSPRLHPPLGALLSPLLAPLPTLQSNLQLPLKFPRKPLLVAAAAKSVQASLYIHQQL